jgi:hypothetical protein
MCGVIGLGCRCGQFGGLLRAGRGTLDRLKFHIHHLRALPQASHKGQPFVSRRGHDMLNPLRRSTADSSSDFSVAIADMTVRA